MPRVEVNYRKIMESFTISYNFLVTKIKDKQKVGLETTLIPLDNKMYQSNKMTSWKQ